MQIFFVKKYQNAGNIFNDFFAIKFVYVGKSAYLCKAKMRYETFFESI